MAEFIAISGPSASGKTEIFDELKYQLREESGIVFMPDIFRTVWQDLIDQHLFYEEEDINRDSELLCCYVQRIIDKYKEYIDLYKDSDNVVVIDSCWLDISIYSTINMWYNRILKEVQESLLSQIGYYDDNLSRIYITRFNAEKNEVPKYRSRYKRYNVKYNRPLEVQYYSMASNFRNAMMLPDADTADIVNFIIEDFMKMGYYK